MKEEDSYQPGSDKRGLSEFQTRRLGGWGGECMLDCHLNLEVTLVIFQSSTPAGRKGWAGVICKSVTNECEQLSEIMNTLVDHL